MLPTPQAFADESFLETDEGGFYVLAAALFEAGRLDEARHGLVRLRGPRHAKKLHWHQMDGRQRLRAAAAVHDLGGLNLVVVGAPVPRKRHERARAKCLERLVTELHGQGVSELFVESRTPVLNQRDVQTVVGARFNLPKRAAFRVAHVPGAEEPLFWAADVVAGAVRAHLLGDHACRDLLASRIKEFEVLTGC
ncbi:hypothetical protein [Actinokineospora cianjurensis]|uniref:hypothetical protein n=1 Tax=Actinokineospora cianjurensis TaxID=585224 RepID=UPI001FE65F9B|nr:hypothetical protein [Actinokineospora cianjurensis]